MTPAELDPQMVHTLLCRALQEDLPGWTPEAPAPPASGRLSMDRTTHLLLPEAAAARRWIARMRAKQEGIVAGLILLPPLFRLLDATARVEILVEDGEAISAGRDLAEIQARTDAVLAGERTALNFVQHLSGVATMTARYVEHAMATGIEICDTRKTLPGLRDLEKYAVRMGGGANHRRDLSAGILVKENHLLAAYRQTGPDSVARAVRLCREELPAGENFAVEVESLAELDAALEAAGERRGDMLLLLDDLDLGAIRHAVHRVRSLPPPRPRLEVTGGVRPEHVEALAATGIHRASAGALTQGAPALDIHFYGVS